MAVNDLKKKKRSNQGCTQNQPENRYGYAYEAKCSTDKITKIEKPMNIHDINTQT